MAAGGSSEDFDVWLNSKLNEFEADESVFGSYIRGILEGEETLEEKKEALESILSEMTETDITKLCQDILERWAVLRKLDGPSNSTNGPNAPEDVDVRLARLMENQTLSTTVRNSNYTDEEKRIREAILSQYGQYSDDEGESGSSKPSNKSAAASSSSSSSTQTTALEKNLNAASVAQAEREKREQSKLESQKKKEKDKEDREKQKQAQADKKEKRKTQKGERRR